MNACEMIRRCIERQQGSDLVSLPNWTIYGPGEMVEASTETLPIEEHGNGAVLVLDDEPVPP